MTDDSESGQQGSIVELVQGLLTRRRRWILPTMTLVTLAAITISYRLPNHFTSEATILVVQQRVPERYVTPTSTTDIARNLEVMTEDVLSRTQLLSIIDELGLYPNEKARLAPEELVDVMRKDVSIKPVQGDPSRKDVNALKVSFTTDKPQLAQAVTRRISALFIQQNLKAREEQATSTTAFLHEQLDEAGKNLAEQEGRLRDFKMQYIGELPEQQQANLGILGSLQTQLQNVSSSLSRAQQQRLYLESLLSQYHNLARQSSAALPGLAFPMQAANATAGPTNAAERELARLQSEQSQLLLKYTPNHPDVLRKSQEVSQAQRLLDLLKATAAGDEEKAASKDGVESTHRADGPKPEGARRGTREDDAVVAQLKSQLEANKLEIESLQKSEQQLKASTAEYQGRLNLTPVREQQLTALLRDYELTKQHYADLLSKEQQSRLATTLEKHQEGQQFRMVDPPNVPMIPSSPKRMKIALGGAAAGLLLGLALAFLLEKTDSSFHSEKTLSQQFEVPIVISIPLQVSNAQRRARWLWGTVECVASAALALIICAAEFYVYRHG